jgi:hypothetical protein
MNERRDDWAQAFGESVGIVAIGFGLLGTAQDHAARFRSAKRVLGSLRDHAALFLGERSIDMQHERIAIGPKLGDDERHLLRHQSGDESDIAR